MTFWTPLNKLMKTASEITLPMTQMYNIWWSFGMLTSKMTSSKVKLFRYLPGLDGILKIICQNLGEKYLYQKSRIYFIFRNCEFQTYGNQSVVSNHFNGGKDSLISAAVHDQSESYLCWVFSFATSNKSSLKLFISGLNIPDRQIKRCMDKLSSRDFHHTLRNEVCMLIPTDYKQEGQHQGMHVRSMMLRVSFNLYYRFNP